MKNYEVLIVVLSGLGIAYYMYKKTNSAAGPVQQPIGNVSVKSVQASKCAFSTVPLCCVGTGGVRLQPTTMIPAVCSLIPPECIV